MANKPIDLLIKFLNADNVCDILPENDDFSIDQRLKHIAQDVIKGYKIDEESKEDWITVNKTAMDLIKNQDALLNNVLKDFPFKGASQLIFPLLGPAVIQMGA